LSRWEQSERVDHVGDIDRQAVLRPSLVVRTKFDGELCFGFRARDDVRLLTRNRKQVGDGYPELVEGVDEAGVPRLIAVGQLADGRRRSWLATGPIWVVLAGGAGSERRLRQARQGVRGVVGHGGKRQRVHGD
jgi:hypothetical protein